ncbi:molecular chaperone GrpE [Pelagirhabdus alkalitolerans]|uniref:Protein GrpE n=1 Tax=Pelagirhabdus alkalitolerans TaxID=1612202 RepID=A0A1G6HX07_9BACI|nr:nucleotide exchange factor GrpE [Pelagirhabdus alkalitolerans]SDB98006.1 molecular chaperone GrpE [Pelagirhabdus alkalitolerans]
MSEENREEVIEEVEEVEEAEQELVSDTDEQKEEAEEISELDQVKKEKEDLQDKYVRLQAEYDNFRKRTQREKAADLKYKSQSVVEQLLPVVDNFERALEAKPDDDTVTTFYEGMEMIYRQLEQVLESEGVEEIKTVGEAFDPNVHQAVLQVEDDNYDSNVVVEEMQKGYRLKDRVIRPAMVKVNQ